MSFTLTPSGSKRTKIFVLVLFLLFTLLAVINQQITVFYLIYLFWIDEVLKTIFDWIAYLMNRNQIILREEFRKTLGNRSFFLSIYFVFIIVAFGFMINFKNDDLILKNFEVFFFKNKWFTFSVLTFLFRELSEFIYRSENEISAHHLLSSGIITLHLSIILGLLLYASSTWMIQDKITIPETISTVLSILPFLVLKFIFDVMAIQKEKENY